MSADIIHLHAGWTPVWSFGEKLRKIRRETGLNQEDFARAIGVGRAALGHWESGRNTPVHLADVAAVIEQVTGASAEWLLEGSGHKPTGPKRPRQESNLRPRDYKANVSALRPYALQVAS